MSKSSGPNSMVEMIKGRWREFVREPSAFFFVIFMPVLWMVILGFAFSKPHAESFGIGWLSGTAAPGAHDALASNSHIRLVEGSEADLDTALKRGDVLLIVGASGDKITMSFDPANRDAVRARSVVSDIVQRGAGRVDLLKEEDKAVEVPGTRYVDFLVPGLMALSIMTSSLFGTGAVIVVNRRENLLKRYLATPMRPFEYIVSHIVGRCFILFVEVAAILVAGYLLFHFEVRGNFVSLLILALLGAATFTSLAMLCGSRTSNMGVMNGMTNLITMPMMLIGGVWFSRANFPKWIAEPARYLPLTALVDGFRKVALEGMAFSSLGFEMAVLAFYLIVCTVLAKVLFKWY